MTTFAIKLSSIDLPDFGSSEELCRNFNETGVKNSNPNVNRFIVN